MENVFRLNSQSGPSQNLTNCSQVLNKNFDDWAKIYKYVIWKQPPMEEDLQMFKQT